MVLWQKRYLALEPPEGSVRFSLLQPPVSSAAGSLEYCDDYSGNNTTNLIRVLPCLWWDEADVLLPGEEETALLITTRVSPVHQQLPNNCTQRQPGCRYVVVPSDDESESYFIADIERFTLMIEHSYQASGTGLEGSSTSLPGEIVDEDGNVIVFSDSQVGVFGKQDIFTIKDLLVAAGISSLDAPSLANPARSMRDDGVVITMDIEYSNTWSYSLRNVRYRYQLSSVAGTKFKSVQIKNEDQKTSERWLDDRHGVRLIIRQTGELGKFDFPTLVLTVVSGAALVSVAKLALDAAIQFFGPLKSLYAKFKFEETPSFYELVDVGEEETLQARDALESEEEGDEENQGASLV